MIMKKLMLACIMAVSTMMFYSVNATPSSIEGINEVFHNETEVFKVYGNCGMCKKRIESSLKGVKGVSEASWDVKTKMITITYDPHVITLEKVKSLIAEVGHDTDEIKAKDSVYNQLPGCCQYDRK